MKLEKILEKKPTEIIAALSDAKLKERPYEDWKNQYGGRHEIETNDLRYGRKDKIIKGVDEDGISYSKTEYVTRNIIRLQQLIVDRATSFAVGGGTTISLVNDDEAMKEPFDVMRKALKRAKTDQFDMRLMDTLNIESACAELWWVEAKEVAGKTVKELHVKMISREEGNEFYPHFDENKRMDAFLNIFPVDNDGDEINRAELYTDSFTYVYETGKDYNGYKSISKTPNIFKKINVVFYDQRIPDFDNVKTEIQTLEATSSHLVDTNKYFANPTAVAKGDVSSMPNKDDTGKMVQIDPIYDADGNPTYGSLEYLVWAQSPKAVEFEWNMMKNIVMELTQTPDISFNSLAHIGGNIAYKTLKAMLIDSYLKANKKRTLVLGNFERRMNVIKNILATIYIGYSELFRDMEIEVQFGNVVPQDIQETIETLSLMRPGKNIASVETVLANNPMVKDVEKEKILLESEEGENAGTFNL